MKLRILLIRILSELLHFFCWTVVDSLCYFFIQLNLQLDNPCRMMQSITKNSEGFGFHMARLMLEYQFKFVVNSLWNPALAETL
jgi:hypothetical protein